MKRLRENIFFYGFVLVGNAMVWGMFTLLNVPHISAPVYAAPPTVVKVSYTPTIGVPQRIVIPALGLDLPVGEGQFDPATSGWTLSDDKAFFANASVPANDSNGTTLLYGHAREGMFGPLARIQTGMEAHVYTHNAKRFVYKYASMREVVPTDVSVFTDQGQPTLVMQTCSGPWDSYRSMYSFDFVETVPA